MDWFQLGKEYDKAVDCHSAYVTYMQSIPRKILSRGITSWNQDRRENINSLRYADDGPLMAESKE